MTKTDKGKDKEMLLQAVAYLENLIVPSKELGFIYYAVCYLRKTIEERGGIND
ncbi:MULTISPECIES: hypothetical protein [Clostridium]|uniref:Uncharacterized protein n=1 Tax=Clostridium frigoriphilum TaxID=443253 RepID=A0ABU7UR92_9CLOT|nr:hypothetical protein [Clostridium sp. DSM 17811]MBU3100685.1 hypothetical protein [Clostridium sp. DSM 17811]